MFVDFDVYLNLQNIILDGCISDSKCLGEVRKIYIAIKHDYFLDQLFLIGKSSPLNHRRIIYLIKEMNDIIFDSDQKKRNFIEKFRFPTTSSIDRDIISSTYFFLNSLLRLDIFTNVIMDFIVRYLNEIDLSCNISIILFLYAAQYIKDVDISLYERCYYVLMNQVIYVSSFSFVKETFFMSDMVELKQQQILGFIDDLYTQIVFNDDINKFITLYVGKCDHKISGAYIHPFINNDIDSRLALIDYTAYCGSLKIFRYLYVNNEEVTEKTFLLAITGSNPEIIHLSYDRLNDNVNLVCFLNHTLKHSQPNVFSWILSNSSIHSIPVKGLLEKIATYGSFWALNIVMDFIPNAFHSVSQFILRSINSHNMAFCDFLISNNTVKYKDNVISSLLFGSIKMGLYVFQSILNCLMTNKYIIHINSLVNGESLLHCCIEHRNLECMKILLDFDDIDVNIRTKTQETPLHWCSIMNDPHMASVLLQHPGININITDKRGDTPLSYAQRKNYSKMVELFDKFAQQQS